MNWTDDGIALQVIQDDDEYIYPDRYILCPLHRRNGRLMGRIGEVDVVFEKVKR